VYRGSPGFGTFTSITLKAIRGKRHYDRLADPDPLAFARIDPAFVGRSKSSQRMCDTNGLHL